MVTNAEEPEVETTADKAEGLARIVIAGHSQGAVRRIVLYAVLALAIAVDVDAVALGALVLLVGTDQIA